MFTTKILWHLSKLIMNKPEEIVVPTKINNTYMVPDLQLEILSMSDIDQYSLYIRVCLIATCTLDVEGNPKSFIFKNSRSVTKEVLSTTKGFQKTYYDMEIYLVNNVKYIPFNKQYFVLDIQQVVNNEDGFNFSVTMPEEIERKFEDYSTEVFPNGCKRTWEYMFCKPIESILKYMVVPYLLTIMQQLTHTVKARGGKGDWIGICATFMLGDIALFFTIPTTSKLTGLERCLFLNFFCKFFIAMFAFYDCDVTIAPSPKVHHLVDVFVTLLVTMIVIGYYFSLAIKSRFRIDNNGGWKKGIIQKV